MELYYQCQLIHLANNRIDRFISIRLCGMNDGGRHLAMGRQKFYLSVHIGIYNIVYYISL